MIKKSKQVFFVLLAISLSLYLVPPAFATDSPPSSQIPDDPSGVVTPDNPPSPLTDTPNEGDTGYTNPDADASSELDSGTPEADVSSLPEETGGASAEEGLSTQSVAAPVIEYAPIKNTTTVKIALPDASELTSAGVDAVTFKAEMKYKSATLRSVETSHSITPADATTGFIIDLKDYGSFTVTATFTRGGSTYYTSGAATVNVTADEYNIAPVSASLPVAFFSLSLWGENNIRYTENGTIIPTIVMMERPLAWNWDSLPEGVYGLPYLSEENLTSQPASFGEASNKFRANTTALNDYVKELNRISPQAKFHLYVVDFYLGIIQTALYANKIPQSRYTITVLSDGAFSYSSFSNTYSQANPTTTFNTHQAAWNTARDYAYANGTVQSGYALNESNPLTYAAVSQEPSATWWLARPALLETKGDGNAFGAKVQADSKVVRINITTLLTDLTKDEKASADFKALYNFSDEYFNDAENAGKDVMLFLGSTVTAEAGSFPDYARFVMAYYGDRFAYYYKGHPGTPTELYPSKQQELAALGITDVDSSIAAELILFFYPDIYLSGYQSSTYASVADVEMTKGLFATKKSAADSMYLGLMDFFISPVDATTSAAVKEVCRSNVKSYLVEFADAIVQEKGYDIAIWEPATQAITYYRLFSGAYVRYQDDARIVTITSSLSADKLVDIAGGSGASGANVQLYSSNGSAAQRFQLILDDSGYYTIMNLKSGKVLDVQYAGKVAGTNVWQYVENGTDAQKWKMVATGDNDGSVYLVSKLNDKLYLDVSGANTANSANIQVYTSNGTKAQKFFVEDIQPVLEDGTYTFRSKVGVDMVMDIASGSHSSRANAQLYRSNNTNAQKFDVRFDASSGYYVITNIGSGKVLDVQYAGFAPATNVWQYDFNNTVAQMWVVTELADGSFTFQTALGSGHCLDVAGAQTGNGINIQVYPANGTNAQKWVLE